MSPSWRSVIRTVVILAGAGVFIAGVLQFRVEDWRIYIVFFFLSGALFLPAVEVLPRVTLAIPEMAATIGFLYIGGLPIIVLRFFSPLLTWPLRGVLPEAWKEALPRRRTEIGPLRRQFFTEGWAVGGELRLGPLAELATFSLGLGARWWIATALVAGGAPVTNAAIIALAELGGYACWSLLSRFPIYPDRTLVPIPSGESTQTAFADIAMVLSLALTPFVFLISYGFQLHGLPGAVAWSLSALGLHFMLKRLHERRLRVEEQNRRLETLNRELEHRERLSAIGKMSSVVSHQILHQLGVIGIYADLIRNADEAGQPADVLAKVRTNALAIEGALQDVNRVLRDLLVFSKDLRIHLYEHPLARVIDECREDCRAEAAARNVALRVECPAAIHLALDKLKMKQALVNIVRNAIEVSPTGSEVVVQAALRDAEAELTIRDQGPGIPAGDHEAIFTPFYTTKEHGTGLGLAIARAFTEAHGGRLWAESAPAGPGAVFRIRLPREPASGHR